MNQGTILGSQIGRWIVLAALVALLGALLLTIRPVGAQSDPTPVIDDAPATFTHAENSDDAIYTFRARDPEGKKIFWTLTGTDAADFKIDGGALSFKSAPDFEMATDRVQDSPVDGADNNVYNVTVRFSDGGAPAGDHPVKVTVANAEEPGMITLSPLQPQVGSQLTATLTDSDGNIRAEYQWAKSDAVDGTYIDINGAKQNTYTPAEADDGSYLRVTARYVDGHDTAIDTETANTTLPVQADTHMNEAPAIPTAGQGHGRAGAAAGTAIVRYVAEDAMVGADVGPPVTAVDDNLNMLTYSLGPDGTDPEGDIADAASFSIHPATGQITTNRPLDFDEDHCR